LHFGFAVMVVKGVLTKTSSFGQGCNFFAYFLIALQLVLAILAASWFYTVTSCAEFGNPRDIRSRVGHWAILSIFIQVRPIKTVQASSSSMHQ
jgi:hypothetical protein